MIINHNITALNTYRQLNTNSTNQSKSMAKLSSGLRINSAADDAAGLSISEKMKGQIRGLDQASRNAQDGISLIGTAEGALNETQEILQRMRELATQASNGTLTDKDRDAIQKEANQLTSEVNRIGNTTQFNTQNLLKGTNKPATTTAATDTALVEGETGIAAGGLTDLTTLAKSVVGIASKTTVQGQTSAATGEIGNFVVTQNSIKGVKSSATISDGLTFTSNDTGTSLNDSKISIEQAAGNGASTSLAYDSSTKTYKFTIGTDAQGNSLATNQGTLYNQVSAALTSYNGGSPAVKADFSVDMPTNTAAPLPASIATTGTFAGGVTEQAGVSQFTIKSAIKESGDTVTVAGKTFTAVKSGATAKNGEFNVDSKLSYVSAANAVDLSKDLTGTTGASLVVKVGGTDYTLGNADIASLKGTASASDLVNMIANKAVDASGNKLSDVADVSIGSDNKLQFISKDSGVDIASVTVTDGTAGASGHKLSDLLGNVTAGFTANASASTGATAADQARSLRVAMNSVIGTHYSASGTATAGQITLTENVNQASGVNVASPTISGSGKNNVLNITNGNGDNLKTVKIVQSAGAAGVAAVTGTIDGTFKLTAANNNTELNGVSVKFSGLSTSTSANAFTTTWDADTRTLTVSGNIDSAAAAGTISTDIGTAVTTGLKNAGYAAAGAIAGTAGGSAGAAGAAEAALNGKTITFGSGATAEGSADTMTVDEQDGNLTIHLASTTAAKNSAANIQAAVQALGKVNGTDYSKFTVTSSGNWDTTETGSNITHATGTLVGGTKEVDGSYSTTLTQPFAVGDTVTIKGQTFTAVASGADSTKGQFDVGNGTLTSQAASLANAINLNSTLGNAYQATTSGATLNLTEYNASGKDLKTTDVGVAATGVKGQYSVSTDQLITDGGSISIDGQKISVSSKTTNVGYANGTAIKEAATLAQQNQSLADAINKNSDLSKKYTASVDSDGKLLLDQKVGNSNAPEVSTTTSTKGDYTSSFQIGANAGQSMSISIKDMRATALGISGDGSVGTVQAEDGKVASYVAVSNVTNGTDDNNVEFALDLSTKEKATAAISVLDDAINAVSAQRSALGAYQNRLEHTINNLNTSSQNITDAQSRIADVDMAKEMMNQTKSSVLAQAAQAMLAQANQQPQQVLQLLRG